MAFQIQDQPPNQKPQLGVSGLGACCATTDSFTTHLSLAAPGFASFKSTQRHMPKRLWEESQTKIIMSRTTRADNGPWLELRLTLSPTCAVGLGQGSPAQSIGLVSPQRSCVSSELGQHEAEPSASVMVVVGCPRCLMYIMMPEEVDRKCPRCKSHVLLDVVNDPSAAARAANGMVAGVSACDGAKRVRKS